MRIGQGFEEKSRLGRLLINRGYLTEQQLEQGLLRQRESGMKLGEVLIAENWISEKDLQRVLKHQSRYRNAAALVAMATLPFQPVVSFAASNPGTDQPAQVSGQLHRQSGLQPLTEAEMSGVSARSGLGILAQYDRVVDMAGQPSDDVGSPGALDAVEGIKLAAHVFVPVLSFLDSDLTISGVHYREGEPQYAIRSDGGITLALPERIEEIRMDNIRVSGGQTPSMGNVSIRDIQFHPDSRMTIYTH